MKDVPILVLLHSISYTTILVIPNSDISHFEPLRTFGNTPIPRLSNTLVKKRAEGLCSLFGCNLEHLNPGDCFRCYTNQGIRSRPNRQIVFSLNLGRQRILEYLVEKKRRFRIHENSAARLDPATSKTSTTKTDHSLSRTVAYLPKWVSARNLHPLPGISRHDPIF